MRYGNVHTAYHAKHQRTTLNRRCWITFRFSSLWSLPVDRRVSDLSTEINRFSLEDEIQQFFYVHHSRNNVSLTHCQVWNDRVLSTISATNIFRVILSIFYLIWFFSVFGISFDFVFFIFFFFFFSSFNSGFTIDVHNLNLMCALNKRHKTECTSK